MGRLLRLFLAAWPNPADEDLAITIVDAQGYRLTRIRALTRYAFSWIWGLPLLLQLTPWPLAVTHLSIVLGVWVVLWMLASRLHPQGQFWHDAWAKTQLLQAP